MKNKFLSFALAICLMIPYAFALTACGDKPPENPPTFVVYTVTEAEWKTNLNLTKNETQTLSCVSLGSSQTELLSNSTQPLSEITSYTVLAEGVNAGIPGSALLKMTPNGMYIEFYVNGTLKSSESGTFDSDNVLYESVKTNMMMFVPFAEYYDDFTFDETKNAYVAQNLTATLVDDYDINNTETIYHKTAEVSFVNGYLNKVSFEMCDKDFIEIIATFTFTFSNINNTTISD
ncbi:MAG: hypothetical protein IJZ29_04885 [Clostridia bacterium]|nr:hypothetical protein [Clostridia bacterium]